MQTGSYIRIARKGNHNLVIGAIAQVRHVENDGIVMLTIGMNATAWAPVECCEAVETPEDAR